MKKIFLQNKGIVISVIILILLGIVEIINLFGHFFKAGSFLIAGCIVYTILQVCYGMWYLLTANAREEKEKKRVEKQQQEQRESVMLLLRAHFIFNTLNAISATCLTEPENADAAVMQLSDYLRTRFLLIEGKKLTSFTDEYQHIVNYVHLEQLRFGDKIELLDRVTFSDFEVPLLSVQILVENAVRNGISKRNEGGHVMIVTRRKENSVELMIADDGIGFDMKILESDQELSIQKALHQMEELCHAKTEISSIQGEGTRISIEIPLGERQ